MKKPAERKAAIAILVAILQTADADVVGEIVTTAVQSYVRSWTREPRATGADAGHEKPLTYAGAWRVEPASV